MSRRRLAKPAAALIAAGLIVLVVSGCAFVKFKSLTVSQPQGIGSVRVHFNLCTINLMGGSLNNVCGQNEEGGSFQYLVGIAVPPGSVPPANFTAVPVGGGAPIVFTRNDEVASEAAAASSALQKFLAEAEPEPAEAEVIKELVGGPWPPNGLQGVGYLSAPVQEFEGASAEWSVDADFGLPTAADGGPFAGPFPAAIAYGVRVVTGSQPASRPVHCIRFAPEVEPQESEAFCSGAIQQAQAGTSDLRIAPPAKPGTAFVGGNGQVAFQLKFAGSAGTVPAFTLSGTTTAKGGKAKPASTTFVPTGPTKSEKVTVSVPKKTKPGTYQVTLTAQTAQGGVATGVGKLKVTKPKLKFGGVKLNLSNGTATLKVKVPSGGKLTISGKGVKKLKKKSKKAKTLKVKIAASGNSSATLSRVGKVKVKVKATFKPSSGISVSKTKSITLKLH
jgi:hypothetical protein